MFSNTSVLNDIFSSISIPIIIDYLDYNVDCYCFRCLPTCTDLGRCTTYQDGTHQHAESDDIVEGELDLDAMLKDPSSSEEDELLGDTKDDEQGWKLLSCNQCQALRKRANLAPDWLPENKEPIRSKVHSLTQLLTLTTTQKFSPLEKVRQALQEDSSELPDPGPPVVVESVRALEKVEDESSMELPSPSPSPAKEPPPEIRMLYRR